MRSCPICNRIFPSTKEYQFCRFDGANLLTEHELGEASTLPGEPDDMPTLKLPEKGVRNPYAIKMAFQLSEQKDLDELRSRLHSTEEGIQHAHSAVLSLMTHLQEQVEEIREFAPRLNIRYISDSPMKAAIIDDTYGVQIMWFEQYTNTLDGSVLSIVEYRKGSNRSSPTEYSVLPFKFDVGPDFQPVWKEQDESRVLTPEQLAEECMQRLMQLIKNKRE